MNPFEVLMRTKKYILLDGAMGTMLFDVGLESGASPETWNIKHPELVRVVHRKYIDAGSDIILTNSFGGTRYRLKLHQLEAEVRELNIAAARNARLEADSANRNIVVGGSIGPTGELLAPLGTMTFDEAKNAFAEQADALTVGGVDVLWIETMSDLNEIKAAIEGAMSVSDLPIVATMTFDTNGYTMMGVSPEAAVKALSQYNLAAIGANCGNGPGEIEQVIRKMHDLFPDVPLVAKSNAGIPEWKNDVLVYNGTPEIMGEHVHHVINLGAKLIGGCCGNTPDHIKVMAEAINSPKNLVGDELIFQEPVLENSTPKTVRKRRHHRN